MEDKVDDLYKSLIEGDVKGIQKIYQLVFPKVLSFILKNSGSKEDAEDIFQRTLLQLVNRFREKEPPIFTSFEAYSFTACKNQWYKYLSAKKKWVAKSLHINSIDEDGVLEKEIEEKRWGLYEEAFNMLSQNCKTIMTLFYKKIPYKIISEQMGYATTSVARQRVFKCRSKLSKLLKTHPEFKNIAG